MDYKEEQKIIKKAEVDSKLQKALGKDKLFQFECDAKDESIRIGVKEINKYSPYYYERFYTKEELEKKNSMFKAFPDNSSICASLKNVFPNKTTILKNQNNGEIIELILEINFFNTNHEIKFSLERKTMANKDDGLKYLYEIQKKNIKIIEEINNICKENKKDKNVQEILKILKS